MDRVVPNTKKAMEDREEKPKVPARDPDDSLADLVAGQQPQLQREHQPPNISEMKPLTREAYGGGMYANEGARSRDPASRPRAGAAQSADGEREREQEQAAGAPGRLGHPPPPSTGDRDLDITGQSYIQ
ncbi:hypothetical protein U9M48_006008 [Paspalum notatum var. saurae]|uniref:Uncharacterized protein n=1 Tax=Paspalum notatum var. saurae TaxID=547442 RepID=A0AAQ3SJ17_PASNO